MKKIISITSVFLVCLIISTVCPSYARAAVVIPSETNAFVSDYYLEPINQEAPFFDVILPQIKANIKENNTHTVTPYYDKLPVSNNPENFQGLGHTTYANINGKEVTAEAFYRLRDEGLYDPNCGMGLLIYQCIEYKKLHPDEDVKITYSSYRTSVTASVCVVPESKYYGYMRSLYGTNYDEQGFVRISYMLTEAARMGIEVTMLHQLDSYGVYQYNTKKAKLEKRANLNHRKYFEQALNSDCYDSYAKGKKVSDFMNSVTVDWTVEDMTSDMQHVKSASVSHYLATDGTEHKDAVYVGSANLDENNYIGANGNNSSQSGAIVSDHSELYRTTYNYMQVMARYSGQEEIYDLRKYVTEQNVKQIELINSGRADEIPKDEQIIYLGTENDSVFELYFTPFGSSADVWDTVANPFCKYTAKLPKSEDYVEVIWNEFGYGSCHIGDTMSKMFEKAFCDKPNPQNKISLRVSDFDTTEIQKLALGSQIGYRSIKDGTNIHSKDILLSYKENGKRHNVSLMTSCNFYMIAFSYRTNSLLVINETEDSGGNFYNVLGEKYSYGMINNDLSVDPSALTLEIGDVYDVKANYSGKGKLTWKTSNKSVALVNDGRIAALKKGTSNVTVTDGTHTAKVKVSVVDCLDCYNQIKGITCNMDEQYVTTKKIGTLPLTFKTTFSVEKKDLKTTNTLLGNDGNFDTAFAFTINKDGNPAIMIRNVAGYTKENYVFKEVDVATGEKINMTLSINYDKRRMYCYINGELKQIIEKIAKPVEFTEKHSTVIGGDHLNGNATCFPGVIDSVAVWSDFRASDKVKEDYKNGTDYNNETLLAAYDLTRCKACMVKDLSKNKNDLTKNVLWLDKDEVDAVTDFEYSFAVVGDTQTMCESDPEAMESIYDWILKNQKRQKIEYVIGLGDITDDSTDKEWKNANEYIGKLDGKIPYVLTRGNHDDWDDFNRNLHNGVYEKTIDGMMNSAEISLTDKNQPGLLEKTDKNGKVYYVTRNGDEPEGGKVKGDLTNSYRYFSIQGTDYLILTLDFAPSGVTLDWANKVIKAHPKHKVIVVTHAYMYRDGTTIDANDCYPPSYYTGYPDQQNGDDMWEKCFSKHKNVVMVLSGHDPWQNVVCRQSKGENGNLVSQFLVDAQYVDRYIGSTAMVAMFYFSNDGKTLTVRYYSVEKDCYGSEVSQFTIQLDSVEHDYKRVSKTEATLEKDGKLNYVCSICKWETSVVCKKPASFTAKTLTYNGKMQTPIITIKDTDGKTLKANTDYTINTVQKSKDAGTYKALVKFKGKYSGVKLVEYNIKAIDVSKCDISLSKTSYNYNGKAQTPSVIVKNSKGTVLKKNEHYTVEYDKGRKLAGTYNVMVTMKGNYSGTKTLSFKIKPIKMDDCTVKLSKTSYGYNGKAQTPSVIVKNAKGTVLKKDEHYTVEYDKGRKSVGTYKVKVTMKGNYSGTKTLSFKIKPIKMDDCTAKLSKTNYTYDGKVKKPKVTVKNSKGTVLEEGKHYTVKYDKGRKSVGTYKVKVTMKGNYEGTKTLKFKIKSVSVSTCSIKLSKTTYLYDGKVKTPSIIVKNKNGTKLKKDMHYTVSYSKGRKNVGEYKVTVTMKGNYSGTKVLNFQIKPKKTSVSKLTAGEKSIKVAIIKKTAQVTGYQIEYSTSKTFKKSKVKEIESYKTTKYTLKNLSAKKKYYVRVRTYKTVKGKTYYSPWSAYKSAKTK